MEARSVVIPPVDHTVSAYLLVVGKRGTGDETVQRWLSAWRVERLDQVWLSQEGVVSIGDVRAFQQQLQLAPLSSAKRVGIIERAQALSLEAGHALLKFLEDPPPQAVTILIAEHEAQLLPTIVSRCQRWRIQRTEDRGQPVSPAGGKTDWDIGRLQSMKYRERFKIAEVWAKAASFHEQFDDLIIASRGAFLRSELPAVYVDQLLSYREMAETNVNRRLLAETTLLALGGD